MAASGGADEERAAGPDGQPVIDEPRARPSGTGQGAQPIERPVHVDRRQARRGHQRHRAEDDAQQRHRVRRDPREPVALPPVQPGRRPTGARCASVTTTRSTRAASGCRLPARRRGTAGRGGPRAVPPPGLRHSPAARRAVRRPPTASTGSPERLVADSADPDLGAHDALASRAGGGKAACEESANRCQIVGQLARAACPAAITPGLRRLKNASKAISKALSRYESRYDCNRRTRSSRCAGPMSSVAIQVRPAAGFDVVAHPPIAIVTAAGSRTSPSSGRGRSSSMYQRHGLAQAHMAAAARPPPTVDDARAGASAVRRDAREGPVRMLGARLSRCSRQRGNPIDDEVPAMKADTIHGLSLIARADATTQGHARTNKSATGERPRSALARPGPL